MEQAERSVVVFDLGGVLIDWDPRHLYRKLFAGDAGTMEHFLSTVCTPEWNRCQDAGRSFAEGARLLKAEHPDKAQLIDAYGARFDEMLAGPIPGSLEILAELRSHGTPLYGLTNWSADIPFMARLAVGTSWASLSQAQQQQVTAAFGSYISATYADRFDSYAGQRLEVTGHQPSASGVIVKTRIVKGRGEAVGIEYLMRQNGDDWRISDVYLDGSISQLATQRSEFGAILRRDGFDGLIATLNRKVSLLTGNVAKAS